jgi:hypothetical protein
LLDISTSSTVTDDVHGTLKTYELGQTDFIAVSYVWGDESELVPMRLNGALFWATQNADSILKLLCRVSAQDHTAENNELKVFANSKIWIDAISIDQANRPEKEA